MKIPEQLNCFKLLQIKKRVKILYDKLYEPGYDLTYEDVSLIDFADVFPKVGIEKLVNYGPETARQLIRLPFFEICKVSGCSRRQVIELMEAIIAEFDENSDDVALIEFADVFPIEGINRLINNGTTTARQVEQLSVVEICDLSGCSLQQVEALQESIAREFIK